MVVIGLQELGCCWVFGREQKLKEPDIGCAGGMRVERCYCGDRRWWKGKGSGAID